MKEVRAGTGQVGVAVGRPVLSPRMGWPIRGVGGHLATGVSIFASASGVTPPSALANPFRTSMPLYFLASFSLPSSGLPSPGLPQFPVQGSLGRGNNMQKVQGAQWGEHRRALQT